MKMNELQLQKQSLNIEEISDSLAVYDEKSLKSTFEIIKAIRKHKDIIIEYWKSAKEAAKKSYYEILNKEKEMLNVCEVSEKNLKEKILKYKQTQDKKYQDLISHAEIERRSQIENILSEAQELQNQGKFQQAKNKFDEAEKLKQINLSLDLHEKENKISTQKRFRCKVTDNKLVPCFFDGIKIREINTKKLLEIKRKNPEVKIPGVEFYKEENLIIRSV